MAHVTVAGSLGWPNILGPSFTRIRYISYFPNMPHSEKRRRRRRPSLPSGKRAGGHWGDQLRERLRQLVVKSGQSQAAFAKLCGIDPPRLSDWLAGKQLPSLESLRQIGAQTGVSMDWLLFAEEKEGLRYRGQARITAELESDLATEIRRHIHEREAAGAFDRLDGGGVRIGLEHWIVDGAGLLNDLRRAEEAKVKAWLQWEEQAGRVRGLSDDVLEALRALAPLLPADDHELGRHIYRLGQVVRETREMTVGMTPPERPNSYRGFSARFGSHPVVGPAKALAYLERELVEDADPPREPVRRPDRSGRLQ